MDEGGFGKQKERELFFSSNICIYSGVVPENFSSRFFVVIIMFANICFMSPNASAGVTAFLRGYNYPNYHKKKEES